MTTINNKKGKNADTVIVTVKPSTAFHKKLKRHCVENDITLNDYFLKLAVADFRRRSKKKIKKEC